MHKLLMVAVMVLARLQSIPFTSFAATQRYVRSRGQTGSARRTLEMMLMTQSRTPGQR